MVRISCLSHAINFCLIKCGRIISLRIETLMAPILGGCGQMFEAIIVSPQFDKKTTLARHRLVNTVLKDEIAAIHAWTPKCFTPEQWEKKRAGA